MKKTLLIVLVINMIILIVGCSSGADNYQPNENYYKNNMEESNTQRMTSEEALTEAKQEVVNKICQANNVDKITISYGTEEIYESGSGWSVKLKGTYRTVNDYGEVDYSGDRKKFSYSGTVFDGGWVSISGSCK